MSQAKYKPIADYGIIGNMRTCSLVGLDGSIDWMCFPNFDSPSVFAAIIDSQKGGSFSITPADSPDAPRKQLYWPDTNVLLTRFLCEQGVAEVTDFMPVSSKFDSRTPEELQSGAEPNTLIRTISGVRGSLQCRVSCRPAFDFARVSHETKVDVSAARFRPASRAADGSALPTMRLTGPVSFEGFDGPGGGVTAEFTVSEGETVTFLLEDDAAAEHEALGEHEAESVFHDTVAYWRRWLSQCTYEGRWREMVHRSALTLKLLTFAPIGAIVAAPTCALPEAIGGERNWDYRYTWIRDAAFTVYGLMRVGFSHEAQRFMEWIEARANELGDDGSLQIMYGLDGRHKLTEETLDHLDGYRGSRPVRVGNAAYDQLQLDIYGELLDSVYLYNKYGEPISYDFWVQLRKLVDYVCENWNRADEGVWEVRGGRQHFTYSRLMCWVAVDRGLRLAEKRSFPADRDRWQGVRDEIYEDIMEHGYSSERGAFVQSYGSTTLDASNLTMPLVFFVSPTDRRMLSTLRETLKSPEEGGLVSNSLVYRYNAGETDDGLAGEEGTFNICSFWLVEALTRAGRSQPAMLEQARLVFEKMIGYANHLGMYAEETGPTGEALGNAPQAFTHLSLISAAHNLNRTLR